MKSLTRLTEAELLELRESVNRELLKRSREGFSCPDCQEYSVCGIYWAHLHNPETGECEIRPAWEKAE